MNEQIHLNLTKQNMENLETYAKVLNKDINDIFNESLELYFKKADEQIAAQSLEGDGTNTNLDFDEFWDGVEV